MTSNQNNGSTTEQPEVPSPTARTLFWPKLTTDYHDALLRLVTMRAARTHYLLFGYVELFPRDIPVPDDFKVGDKPWPVPGLTGSVTLGASATRMTIPDALSWYENAASGKLIIPLTDPPIELVAPPFGVEPSLGRFCVGEAIPFAAAWHDGPRIHRLIPMEDPVEVVQQLRENSPAREWLATNVGFDPFEYEEWLASVSLLAPDPLFSGVGQFMQDHKEGDPERLVLQAYRRHYDNYPHADASMLQLVILQQRPAGWTEVLPTTFDTDGFAIKEYPEPVSETGFAISCPSRGLIRMVTPTLFITRVDLNIGLADTVFEVEVPSGGRRKPAGSYKTHRVKEGGSVQVGEALPRSGAIRIAELQEARKRRIRIQSAPQRLFGTHEGDKDELTAEELSSMRSEAESYVAGLVAGAQRRAIFVDPDFGVREFQSYALRVVRDGVTVTILTGAPHMRRSRPNENTEDVAPEEGRTPSSPPGIMFLAQLQHVRGLLGSGAPDVLVMPGSRKPLFHDRFLVVDNVVWACGPSFNELGERIGLISQVHEPGSVIAAIERAITRSKPLADWVAEAGHQGPAQEMPDGV